MLGRAGEHPVGVEAKGACGDGGPGTCCGGCARGRSDELDSGHGAERLLGGIEPGLRAEAPVHEAVERTAHLASPGEHHAHIPPGAVAPAVEGSRLGAPVGDPVRAQRAFGSDDLERAEAGARDEALSEKRGGDARADDDDVHDRRNVRRPPLRRNKGLS
jgi:hypothetical protein